MNYEQIKSGKSENEKKEEKTNDLTENNNNINKPIVNEEKNNKEKNEIEINLQPNPLTTKTDLTSKKKKEWKSWSPQEKILFYEIIANGGNYGSLQKLFKTVNDVSDLYLMCRKLERRAQKK